MSHNQIFLSEAQTAIITAAAASLQPCWREQFLARVQDHLLDHETDRPISDDQVVKAIDGVRWAMFAMPAFVITSSAQRDKAVDAVMCDSSVTDYPGRRSDVPVKVTVAENSLIIHGELHPRSFISCVGQNGIVTYLIDGTTSGLRNRERRAGQVAEIARRLDAQAAARDAKAKEVRPDAEANVERAASEGRQEQEERRESPPQRCIAGKLISIG